VDFIAGSCLGMREAGKRIPRIDPMSGSHASSPE
jgi:hypothetical protein